VNTTSERRKPAVPKENIQKGGPRNQVISLDALGAQVTKLSKSLNNPKDKDKYYELKEKYYKEFLLKINQTNGITISFPKSSFTPYKYYIGRGNNSMLVRACLKTRFWWSMGDFDEWVDYNFIWTQWKSNKVISKIKTHKEMAEKDK
jgi:hypothetical protein